MKNFFELLTTVIGLLEKFVAQRGKSDMSLDAFIYWLNRETLFTAEFGEYRHESGFMTRQKKSKKKERKIEHKKSEHGKEDHGPSTNVQITLLLHMLSKHFKVYSKKVLSDSDLVSMDGHIFLSMICSTDSMRKMELIKANFSEVPSGIEVIKRLLRKGFIEEFDDPDDKRSKRVKVTDKGRTEYEATLPPLSKVIKVMAGNMSWEKKVLFVSLLDELNEFHVALHEEAKNMTLEQLVEKCDSAHQTK